MLPKWADVMVPFDFDTDTHPASSQALKPRARLIIPPGGIRLFMVDAGMVQASNVLSKRLFENREQQGTSAHCPRRAAFRPPPCSNHIGETIGLRASER